MIMELDTFISTSLIQIVSGVQLAQEHVREMGAIVNPEGIVNAAKSATLVDKDTGALVVSVGFDVVVTVDESKQTKGGLGLVVGSIALGAQAKATNANNSETRITFSVPIVLPIYSHLKVGKRPAVKSR